VKIAIIGTNKIGGGLERAKEYRNYLLSKNHDIDLMIVPDNTFNSNIWFYYNSIIGRLIKDSIYIVKIIGDKLENIIRKGKYDAVIGVESRFSHVLTKKLNCLKIFSCESLESEERYFSKKYDLKEIKRWRDLEIDILNESDYVIFPWRTTEEYVRKNVLSGSNFVTIKYGCHPKEGNLSHSYFVSIVSLGSLGFYWSNKDLLSHLTKISPYIIDVYGKYRPEKRYGINYRGYAKSLDIFYDYQFGLNTVSRDPFRREHFSSRIISYLAYGLPVLFPEWQKFPRELGGCVPYNEDNFPEVVEKHSERDKWDKLCDEAKRQGRELDWKKTLKPLDKLLEK